MDVTDASNGVSLFSGVLGSLVEWFSKVISWSLSFRNMLFVLFVIGVAIIAYKLFEDDVNRKKYAYGRRKEI